MITVSRKVSLDVGVDSVWEFLWDIPRLSGCIPGCRKVEMLADQQLYAALMEQQVGPFKLAIDMQIRVAEVEPLRRVALAIAGQDPKLQVKVDQDLRVALDAPAEGKTEIVIDSEVNVGGGALARVGKPLLQMHINRVVDDFVRSLRNRIEAAAAS